MKYDSMGLIWFPAFLRGRPLFVAVELWRGIERDIIVGVGSLTGRVGSITSGILLKFCGIFSDRAVEMGCGIGGGAYSKGVFVEAESNDIEPLPLFNPQVLTCSAISCCDIPQNAILQPTLNLVNSTISPIPIFQHPNRFSPI